METVKKIRKQSQLQQLKSAVRSVETTTDTNLPKSFHDLKDMKYRELALKFSNDFISGKVSSKSSFCKKNHISSDSLNRGLKTLGCQTTYRKDNNKDIKDETKHLEDTINVTKLEKNINKQSIKVQKDFQKLQDSINKQKDLKIKAGYSDNITTSDELQEYINKMNISTN